MDGGEIVRRDIETRDRQEEGRREGGYERLRDHLFGLVTGGLPDVRTTVKGLKLRKLQCGYLNSVENNHYTSYTP